MGNFGKNHMDCDNILSLVVVGNIAVVVYNNIAAAADIADYFDIAYSCQLVDNFDLLHFADYNLCYCKM